MTDAHVFANDWSFSIDGKMILNHVAFSIEPGQFVSIVGPNGAGKTTLIKCLMRIHRGGTGSLRVHGKDIDRYSQRELARLVSYVPQATPVRLPYTVSEFVIMGRYPHISAFSPPGRTDLAIAEHALELTGMVSFRHRNMETLSGGERQKAFVAAALAQEAELLLLDEPTAFLDPHHEDELYQLLSRINREDGKTLIVVTHDINHAALMSDQILAMKEGSIVFSGSSADFMKPSVLEHLFEKTFLMVPHPKTGTPVVVSDVWK